MITGQIFVREAGKHNQSGKRLVMVVGVLAVPDGVFDGESQYTVAGNENSDANIDLEILIDSRVDRTEEMQGSSLGQAVLLPIWRI